MENIKVHSLERADLPRLQALADLVHTEKEADYFDRVFDFVEAGERMILLAEYEDQDAGYCVLSWNPKYVLFQKLEMPEIQDLSVAPAFRRRRVATRLIRECEKRAEAKGCEYMGLGVAVNAQFGPAQILYARHGYIPDGNGVTYDRKLVASGEFKPLDDQLCLMMVKKLKKAQEKGA